MLGFISRSLFKFKKIEPYVRLYYCYVRCILEYASPIWNPYYNIYIDKIERVQRKFTRIVAYKFKHPAVCYEMRLQKMNMISLRNRRIVIDQILFFKIVNGITNTSFNHHFATHIPIHNTRFAPSFYWRNSTTNIKFFSIRDRLQRQHNELFRLPLVLNQPFSSLKRILLHSLPAGV